MLVILIDNLCNILLNEPVGSSIAIIFAKVLGIICPTDPVACPSLNNFTELIVTTGDASVRP